MHKILRSLWSYLKQTVKLSRMPKDTETMELLDRAIPDETEIVLRTKEMHTQRARVLWQIRQQGRRAIAEGKHESANQSKT